MQFEVSEKTRMKAHKKQSKSLFAADLAKQVVYSDQMKDLEL